MMENLGQCDACPLQPCLVEQGEKVVSYRGDLGSDVVVIGSSPTKDDLIAGEPLVGAAGQLVMETLNTVGFEVDKLLYVNVAWCMPTGNLDVNAKVMKSCAPNINAVVGAYPRKVIIALGSEAQSFALNIRSLKGARASCGQVKRSEQWDCWVVSSVHPSYVLRSPAWKPELEMAMRRAFELFTTGEPKQPDVTIHHLQTVDEYVAVFNVINAADIVSFDIETDAVRLSQTDFRSSYQEDHILGVGFAWEQDDDGVTKLHATYLPIHHGYDSKFLWSVEEWRVLYSLLKQVLESKKLTGQNLKFDCRNLIHQYGFNIVPWFDTMIAHRLLDETKPNGLKFMSRFYLNAPDWDIMDTVPVGQHLGCFDLQAVGDYCCYDCINTLLLTHVFLSELEDTPFERLMFHLDMPLFNELTNVELKGMLVDRSACNQALEVIEEEVQKAAQEVDITSGWAGQVLPHKEKRLKSGALSKTCQIGVNASSHLDVGFVMYNHFGLSLPDDINEHLKRKHTKKDGDAKTDNTTIQYMIGQGLITNESPSWTFIQAMLRYRSLKTLRGYVHGVVENTYPDGRVHTNFGFQQGSVELRSPVTGRLSSNSPSMQNVTKPLRPCWVADPGHVFIESDYSALEIRVWAYMSQDPKLLEALDTGDFHTYTAASAYGITPDEITKEQRGTSKTAIFGVIYGGGSSVLGRAFGWEPKKCDEFLNRIYKLYPRGKDFLDSLVTHCTRHGWVETMFGRRRRLPEIWSNEKKIKGEAERQARNSPIQGGASELCSLALIRLTQDPEYDRLGAWVTNNIHDSIVSQATIENAEAVKVVQERVMGVPPFKGFNVPLLVETDISYRWGGDFNPDALREL
jgi:uracil-DNA glycosylase family 4